MPWVFKTEPAECSIDDIGAAGTEGVIWEGVRNYQARNFLRDQVAVGDGLENQPPQPRQVEHVFHHDGARQQRCKLQSHHRDHRDHRVAQHMLGDDHFF